ncbi:MAG: GntR family transcriptional regulator [Caldilineaceae bacterium]|nr:GntR family transcriptional regulator [Caldilineaceae bacterium]
MSLLDLAPVEQRTLSDEAAHRLRTAIRNGVLRPGMRLVERDLAERLGMSRIPVREAIQRLLEEGLVEKSPHRGTFVYAPTKQEIEEISSMRTVLERFVVERVMEHWTEEIEVQLREIVRAMRQAAKEGDWQQIHECDYLFHSTLWSVANHTLLLEVVSGLRSRINRFLFEVSGALPTTDMDQHINSHDQLIDVLKAGNVANAQREMTAHVLIATKRIMTYCNLSDDALPDFTPTPSRQSTTRETVVNADGFAETVPGQPAGKIIPQVNPAMSPAP